MISVALVPAAAFAGLPGEALQIRARQPAAHEPRVRLLSDGEAWRVLPAAEQGGGQPLPTWARALARSLPRTTAAMLELDRLQRTQSPLGPLLRGKMRWIAADANRCDYSRVTAAADLQAGRTRSTADQGSRGRPLAIARCRSGRRWRSPGR